MSWIANPGPRDERGPMKEYATSKQCQICFTKSLASEFSPKIVSSFAVTPGMVNTSLGRYHWLFTISAPIRFAFLATPEAGARPVVVAASDPSLMGRSDDFFGISRGGDFVTLSPSEPALDPELQEVLKDFTDDMIG